MLLEATVLSIVVSAIPLKSICSYDVSRQMHKEGRTAAADSLAVAMVSLYGDQRCNISVKVLHSPPYAVCQGRGMLVVLVYLWRPEVYLTLGYLSPFFYLIS